MADHCSFCDTRRPTEGTNILVLGDEWLEFCPLCGETETLRNAETGETVTLAELFRRSGGTPKPVDPETARRARLAREEAEAEQYRYIRELQHQRERREAARLARRIARRGPIRGGLNTVTEPLPVGNLDLPWSLQAAMFVERCMAMN